MEGTMHLSGQLSDWSINDLLQIMQVTKKTGSLDIEADSRGRIHFKDGTVTGAELTGPGGTSLGEDRSGIADVIYVLSGLTTGSFSVGAADGPDGEGWSVEDVLADVGGLRELEADVAEAGLFAGSKLRLVNKIETSVTIESDDWASLVALISPFAFDELEARSGRGGAVRILHALHRMGVVEVAERDAPVEDEADHDDESGWLDRLADDIVPESDEPTWVEEAAVAAEPADSGLVPEIEVEPDEEDSDELAPVRAPADVRGVSAPASTTLTDGVYDEIRRLRSKVADT